MQRHTALDQVSLAPSPDPRVLFDTVSHMPDTVECVSDESDVEVQDEGSTYV